MHRVLVLVSLIFTVLLVGHAVSSNPNSSVGSELASGDVGQLLRGGATIAMLSAIACWPWLVAFARASRDSEKLPGSVFAVLSAALAAFAYSGIASAPTEGIGYYVILYVLAVWLAYPIISRLARGS
jgi:hypothetical protein